MYIRTYENNVVELASVCGQVSASKDSFVSTVSSSKLSTVAGGFNELRPELNPGKQKTSKAHGSH